MCAYLISLQYAVEFIISGMKAVPGWPYENASDVLVEFLRVLEDTAGIN